jgi:hypothetical protein
MMHKSQTQRLKPNKSAVGNFPVSIFYQQIEFFPADFSLNRFWELNQKNSYETNHNTVGRKYNINGM